MKSWKDERRCSECEALFLPHVPRHVVCSERCRRKRRYRLLKESDSHQSQQKLADINGKRYKERLRERFLTMYGSTCACCGEYRQLFLTVDHKQNDGHLERKQKGAEPYRTLRMAIRGYNPNKYQTLCFNCNLGRNLNNGICPHQLEEDVDISFKKERYIG